MYSRSAKSKIEYVVLEYISSTFKSHLSAFWIVRRGISSTLESHPYTYNILKSQFDSLAVGANIISPSVLLWTRFRCLGTIRTRHY